jgi:hypothetical protein
VGGYSSAKAPSQIASVDIIESVAGTKNMADVRWDLMPVRMKILV